MSLSFTSPEFGNRFGERMHSIEYISHIMILDIAYKLSKFQNKEEPKYENIA